MTHRMNVCNYKTMREWQHAPDQTEQQRKDQMTGDEREAMRRREIKWIKGPRDVKQRLLGHWLVFFCHFIILLLTNFLDTNQICWRQTMGNRRRMTTGQRQRTTTAGQPEPGQDNDNREEDHDETGARTQGQQWQGTRTGRRGQGTTVVGTGRTRGHQRRGRGRGLGERASGPGGQRRPRESPTPRTTWGSHSTAARGVDCRWSTTNRGPTTGTRPCRCERLLTGQKAGDNGRPEIRGTSEQRQTAGWPRGRRRQRGATRRWCRPTPSASPPSAPLWEEGGTLVILFFTTQFVNRYILMLSP